MSCIFCAIIAGEKPAAIVGQTAQAVAFLDSRPLFPGHVLVVPRAHVDTLMELPPAETGPLFEFVKAVCRAAESALAADGIFMANNNRVSQSVPHLHVHVIPRRKKDGLKGFFWPRVGYRDDGHQEEIRAQIAEQLAQLIN